MTKRETTFWGSKSVPDIDHQLVLDGMAAAADIVIYLDRKGEIKDLLVSPSNRNIGCLDHWIGRTINHYLTEESIPKLEHHIAATREEATPTFRSTELNHKDGATWELPIRYTILFNDMTDELLLVGRDLTPVAEAQQDLVKTQLALEREYQAMRDFESRYRAILETVREAVLLFDAETGRIEELNAAAASILGEDPASLRGTDIRKRFVDGSADGFVRGLVASAHPDTRHPVTSLVTGRGREVTMDSWLVRSGGQSLVLSYMNADAGAGTEAAGLSDNLTSLFDEGADAIVFTDGRSVITSCNASFLNLCDIAAETEAVGRPVADFLDRGAVDVKMLTDNLSPEGHVRAYTSNIRTNYGATVPVNVSMTRLKGKPAGFAMVFRLNRSIGMGGAPDPATVPKDASQNIIRLVGSSPLKEIVAGTTDVIEKICIETAIEMTNNNRVAAAEMLGLSRQSLYVKLRKYGLIDQNKD